MKTSLHAGDNAHSNLTPRRKHVKSGCRTCKIRKVKCDEGRPACNRCVSTGRTCDGYGIWGGGGNSYGKQVSQVICRLDAVSPWRPACASKLAAASNESILYEWFVCRTAKKIPGIFTLAFWESLLIPSSLSQPAVLHALLCMSYVHQMGVLKVEHGPVNAANETSNAQYLLQHYVMATQEVRRNLEQNADIQSTLVTCITFAYLDFLRGHFRTAQNHISAGLKILRDTQNGRELLDYGRRFLLVTQAQNEVDDLIRDAFTRLYVQVQLFNSCANHTELCLLTLPSARLSSFNCINDAWQRLERIFCDIFWLAHQNKYQPTESSVSLDLFSRQERIYAELSWWQVTFEHSTIHQSQEARAAIAKPMLSAYHGMAAIIANACLSMNEMTYDRFTELFINIISSCTDIWKSRSPTALLGRLLNMPRSIVDIGWIPPLYYTAIKCRFHRIRLHAIRLLESTSHREGIWDAQISAKIARAVMEIEESALVHVEQHCQFEMHDVPPSENLSTQCLPPYDARVSELEVILPDGMDEDVGLLYRHGSHRKEQTLRL